MSEPKQIDFSFVAGGKGSEQNLYHLCQKLRKKDRIKVTGYTKLEINIGDELKIVHFSKVIYGKVLYVGRRNHRGNFENPQDAVGTFFGAVCIPYAQSQLKK